MKTQYKILAVVVLAIALVIAASSMIHPAAAQDNSQVSMKALLETLRDNKTAATIDFAKPLVSGEATWILPDSTNKREISDVGADYVCFSEPWNDSSKERCTPFSNIIGVSYVR